MIAADVVPSSGSSSYSRCQPCSTAPVSDRIEPEAAAIEVDQRDEVDLDRGHDPQCRLATPYAPKQVLVLLGCCAQQPAVTGDELQGANVV